MPPYGTPVPYPAIYPPGGVYAHPNITVVKSILHDGLVDFIHIQISESFSLYGFILISYALCLIIPS